MQDNKIKIEERHNKFLQKAEDVPSKNQQSFFHPTPGHSQLDLQLGVHSGNNAGGVDGGGGARVQGERSHKIKPRENFVIGDNSLCENDKVRIDFFSLKGYILILFPEGAPQLVCGT